jgi:hypothetical protein
MSFSAHLAHCRLGQKATERRTTVSTRYNNTKLKANLKLVSSDPKPKPLRAGGLKADDGMPAGEYTVTCEGATSTMKGRSIIAVLEFRVVEGRYSGTALRQWLTIPEVDGLVPTWSKYSRHCVIALGREVEPGDDLDPAKIFRGRFFSVEAGFRLTEGTGGRPTEENALRCKDHKDFLRVHRIIEQVEFLS